MINTLPEFESRQVLTNDELNWLTCYLDTQTRQSRRFLVGCGVVGGLQVRVVNDSVQVTNGVGITSAGHIIQLSNSESLRTTFTKGRQYVVQPKEKPAFHYLSDIDPIQEDYSESVDIPSLYFANFKSPVIELLEDIVNDGEPLSASSIKGKVAVLFAEIIQKELKDCEDDNCQERGKKYIFNSKVLAVSKEDALVLLGAEYNLQTSDENVIARLAHPWLHLPAINILKPVFSNFPPGSPFDENRLNQEYLRCIKDFVENLTGNQAVGDAALTNIKNYCTSGNTNLHIIQSLVERLSKTNVLTGKVSATVLYQVVYDYCWKFTQAYQELQVTAQQLRAKCFTAETAFPNHVLLGMIDSPTPDFDASHPAALSIFRHDFQSRFVQTEQARVSMLVTTYLSRLGSLATGLDENFVNIKKDIKLTTGGGLYHPLSSQVIPGYFHPSVADRWNEWQVHPALRTYNTNYTTTNEAQTPSADLPYNSLPSSFQGNHSFFRIEGVHGQVAVNALNTVFQLRKKHGLAFEVLMLRVNEKAPFSNSFNVSINEDIESMYQVVRAESMKQISLNVKYLAGLVIKTGTYNKIKATLTKELEESYLFFLNTINTTLLLQPLAVFLPEAIQASNITTNYRAKRLSTDEKFSELETKVLETKAVSNSFLRMENSDINLMKKNFVTPGLFFRGFNIGIGILLFNTLGSLVNSIKADEKFKSTTDISFYTHLLAVSKEMQQTEKSELLFLLALRLYCALKLQDEYLTDNFLELDIQKYRNNLEDDLLPACNELTSFLKKVNIDFVRTDAILAEVVKGEMLDYVDRIKFDDDWVKVIQLDAENKKRNGGLGVENLLERFVKLHPGLAHGCGVPKGGTYVMVYDKANQVMADFYLPYIISSHLRPIQFTFVENKTITLSGNVRDEAGSPVEATLLISNSSIATDKHGFYNVLVTENSQVKIVLKAPGYLEFAEEINIAGESKSFDIVLKKSDIKTTVTVKFVNQKKEPVKRDINILNVGANIPIPAPNGTVTITDLPNTKYNLLVKDDHFEDKQFELTTTDADRSESVTLLEIDFIRIKITSDEPEGYRRELLKNVRLRNPELEIDMTNIDQGSFTTTEKIDITTTPTASVIYNRQSRTMVVTPGEVINEIHFSAQVPNRTRDVRLLAAMLYPARGVERIPSLTINDRDVALDERTNLGNAEITTDGRVVLNKNFNNPPAFTIENFNKINAVIFIIAAQLIAKQTDIIKTKSAFSFTKALTAEELRELSNARQEFDVISEQMDLKAENFYCLLLPPADIKRIKTILKL